MDTDLTAAIDPQWIENVETALYAEHHANLCNCKRWPDGCLNGLVPAFTLATEDILRIAAPLIEAQVRAKVAEEIARAIDTQLGGIQLNPSPWTDGFTTALKYTAGVARNYAVERPQIAVGATEPGSGSATKDYHDGRQEQ